MTLYFPALLEAARMAPATLRCVPMWLACLLFRTDRGLARRMDNWLALSPAVGPLPADFCEGRAAPCFALMMIAARKPLLFWAAMAAASSLPVFIALRWS